MNEYYVYILACYKNGEFTNFYTGQTNDIDRRESEHIKNVITHNTKKYTGRFDYVKLLWYGIVKTRSEALELEQEIKQLSQDDKEDLVNGDLEIEGLIDAVSYADKFDD